MPTYTVVSVETKTAKTGKPYKALLISDGPNETKVNIFSDFPHYADVKVGSNIEGELQQNGKYWNIRSSTQLAKKPNFDRIIEKKQAGIAESQAVKAENIAQAQSRSEKMWAKRSASELVAHHPAYKGLDKVEVEMEIENLASRILNSDLTPF